VFEINGLTSFAFSSEMPSTTNPLPKALVKRLQIRHLLAAGWTPCGPENLPAPLSRATPRTSSSCPKILQCKVGMLPLVVIGFQSRHGGTKLTSSLSKEAPPHARTAPGRPVQHTEKLLSRGARAASALAVSNALAVHAKSQPKSSPLPQRVVTEIALRGQPRQSLRQAQFVLSRRQVPDLQRQIFCGSRSNVVRGERAARESGRRSAFRPRSRPLPSYACAWPTNVRKPRLQPTLLWPGQRQSSSGQAKYGVS